MSRPVQLAPLRRWEGHAEPLGLALWEVRLESQVGVLIRGEQRAGVF